ncbi:TIM barrel protein, partial [Mycolicibacterium poriferae]
MVDSRVSVHSVTFLGAAPDELAGYWRDLGVSRLSLIDTQLNEPRLTEVIAADGYSVETVYHLFDSTAGLCQVIDAAAGVGARAVYMLTGGRGEVSWEEAADRFCAAVQPCVAAGREAGAALAIENASGLYADLHFAHTLSDTVELAERAGLGVCVDLFHCWTEAHLSAL